MPTEGKERIFQGFPTHVCNSLLRFWCALVVPLRLLRSISLFWKLNLLQRTCRSALFKKGTPFAAHPTSRQIKHLPLIITKWRGATEGRKCTSETSATRRLRSQGGWGRQSKARCISLFLRGRFLPSFRNGSSIRSSLWSGKAELESDVRCPSVPLFAPSVKRDFSCPLLPSLLPRRRRINRRLGFSPEN